MTPWTRDDDGALTSEFSDIEAAILRDLAMQVADILQSGDRADPAMARLLPDAYLDDPHAAAEFRRLTAADLAERKAAAIRLIDTMVGADGRVVMTQPRQSIGCVPSPISGS